MVMKKLEVLKMIIKIKTITYTINV